MSKDTTRGNAMRLPTVFLALLLATGQAGAEWVMVGENEREQIFVDADSLRRAGDLVSLRHLQNFKINAGLPFPARSIVAEQDYDCGRRMFRVLSLTAYTDSKGSGEEMFKQRSPDPNKWMDIPVGTFAWMVLDEVCRQ